MKRVFNNTYQNINKQGTPVYKKLSSPSCTSGFGIKANFTPGESADTWTQVHELFVNLMPVGSELIGEKHDGGITSITITKLSTNEWLLSEPLSDGRDKITFSLGRGLFRVMFYSDTPDGSYMSTSWIQDETDPRRIKLPYSTEANDAVYIHRQPFEGFDDFLDYNYETFTFDLSAGPDTDHFSWVLNGGVETNLDPQNNKIIITIPPNSDNVAVINSKDINGNTIDSRSIAVSQEVLSWDQETVGPNNMYKYKKYYQNIGDQDLKIYRNTLNNLPAKPWQIDKFNRGYINIGTESNPIFKIAGNCD